jgi:hypothetical protein
MFLMRAFFLLVICVSLSAQSVQILPFPPSANHLGSFAIMFVSPVTQPLTALQWRISVPHGVQITPGAVQAGRAAVEAKKSVACAEAAHTKHVGTATVCILAGGTQRIPNGQLAVVRLSGAENIDSVTIHVDGVLAVTPNLKAVPLPDAEATMPLTKRTP